MRIVGLWACAIAVLLACASRPLRGQPRDRIFLKDGQILTGTLADPDFAFNTIYGNVHIPNAAAQNLERLNETIETVSTVNNEKLSGYIALEAITLQISGGPNVPVNKELIDRIVFAPRATKRIDRQDYFVMKNGDLFYGKVLDASFRFTTSYGTLDTAFANLLRLEDVNGQTKMYLSDGNIVMGYIDTPTINVETNYGFNIHIPKSSIKLVQIRK